MFHENLLLDFFRIDCSEIKSKTFLKRLSKHVLRLSALSYIIMKTQIFLASLLSLSAPLFSANFYWAGSSAGNDAANWSANKDTLSASSALSFGADNNIFLGNIVATGTLPPRTWYQVNAGSASGTAGTISSLGNITNNSSQTLLYMNATDITKTSTVWDIYFLGTSNESHTISLKTLTQDAAGIAMRIRKNAGTKYLNISVEAVDIKTGLLQLGHFSTTQNLSSVKVTGETKVADGGTLSIISGKAELAKTTLTGAAKLEFDRGGDNDASGANYGGVLTITELVGGSGSVANFGILDKVSSGPVVRGSEAINWMKDLTVTKLTASMDTTTSFDLKAYVTDGFNFGAVNATRVNTAEDLAGGAQIKMYLHSDSTDQAKNKLGAIDARVNFTNTARLDIITAYLYCDTSVSSISSKNSAGGMGRINVYDQGSTGVHNLKIGSVYNDKSFWTVIGSSGNYFNKIEVTDSVTVDGGIVYLRANEVDIKEVKTGTTADAANEVQIGFATVKSKVGAITMTDFSALTLNHANNSVASEIGSITLGDLSKLTITTLGTTVATVTGNVNAKAVSSVGSSSASISANNGLVIQGILDKGTETQSGVSFNGSGAAKTTYSMGGISGGVYSTENSNNSEGNRITSNYSTGGTLGNGQVELKITGTTNSGQVFIYLGRIHDMGTTQAASDIKTGAISITMDAANTTQYLAGKTYIRGTTTVKNGTLFISNDTNKSSNLWWLADISIEGGAFGACGQGTDGVPAAIGTVRGTTLTWSGGNLLFDVAENALSDKIILSGDFLKGADVIAGTKFEIGFDWGAGADLDGETYEIMTWDGSTDFADADFEAKAAKNGYTITFRLEGGSLYADFAAIPEPAEYAALFGLCALLFALRRRNARR